MLVVTPGRHKVTAAPAHNQNSPTTFALEVHLGGERQRIRDVNSLRPLD